MTISVVVFDIGETLINEDRLCDRWAAYLGVPPDVFRQELVDVISRGEHHRKVFERFRPGFDLVAARRERSRRGDPDIFNACDLYPDAVPCLRTLRALGYTVGIAGNQPEDAEQAIKDMGLQVDLVASSERWGVAKPDPAFFSKLIETARVSPSAIALVGDRLDNDVLPALACGMAGILIKRGPWGRLHATLPDHVRASAVIESLAELPAVLERR